MGIDAESFKGKIYLNIIDKLFIGAIIALAFVAYDQYQKSEEALREDKRNAIQREFEQAKLVKELLPLITNTKIDVTARGYMLRSAVITKAIDGEAGVEFGQILLDQNISHNDFQRIMLPTLPEGLPAIARKGTQLLNSLNALGAFPKSRY